MAGHRYVSSTERYRACELGDLAEALSHFGCLREETATRSTDYHWHVRTRVGESKSYRSHIGHFTTASLPQVPLLPLFDWHHHDPGVDHYTWQLHTRGTFNDPDNPPLRQQTGLTRSQYHLTTPLSEQTSYFWRVIAHDTDAPGGLHSAASAPAHFTTLGATPVPPPAPRSTNRRSIRPGWPSVGGAHLRT